MPYILHCHDDTHDKPDTLDEELAQPLLMLQFNDERMREMAGACREACGCAWPGEETSRRWERFENMAEDIYGELLDRERIAWKAAYLITATFLLDCTKKARRIQKSPGPQSLHYASRYSA